MIRDPLYRKIVERLNGTLDSELFEQCAVDLLRSVYLGLVPIRGGSDSGMDGAIADSRGEPLPLITTTSPRAKDNLTRNLKKYVQDGHKRREAVFATSRAFTAHQRAALNKCAEELGFTLLQIHDQADFADRLYWNPQWRKELLNVTGDPAPLSIIPKSERPFVNLPLIGRGADLTWLRQAKGDKLLVGQPGSGKTFLLRKLASENGGLFVNTSDRGEIADGIRSQKPRFIIVDDAQLQRPLLSELRQLREEQGAHYSILASGWLGDEKILAEALNLPSSQVRHLELLPRNDIVKIINATGIGGPNILIRELVDQAEGRPGLAVTLADLCLKGDVRQVALGDALSRSLLKYFESTVGTHATSILAAFSIGGDAGMSMTVVADGLRLSLLDLRDAVVKLAAGGVIMELGREQLAVRPPALREVLVRDVFFRGATSLSSAHLLMQAPSAEQAALTLIGASGRGAITPHELFITILEQANSDRAWREYTSLGREETQWVLTNHPEKLLSIAGAALYYLPEITVPLLLEAAMGDERQSNSTPEHPMRLISDWIQSGEPGTGEPIRRRKVLLDGACTWLNDGKDVNIGLAALTAAFSPRFETSETDPGAGNTVQIRHGIVALEELCAIQDSWEQGLGILRKVAIDDWGPLRHLVTAWALPGHMGVVPPESVSNMMRAFARKLLCDVVAISTQGPEVAYWAKQIAEQLEMDIPIHVDREFEILYPYPEYENFEEAEERQKTAVRELASEWMQLAPEEVARRISSVENTARRAKIWWPRWTSFLSEHIAAQVASPNSWARMMAQTVKIGDLVLPFLREAAARNEPGWIDTASLFLDQPEGRWAAVTIVLTQASPPEDLLDKVLGKLQGYAQLVEVLCLRNEIPQNTLQKLLRHQDATIASAAALGAWHGHRTGPVPESLRDDWREAILRATDDEHWLREVLIRDPALAYAWLERRLTEHSLGGVRIEATVGAAVSVLDVDTRRKLLCQVPATSEMQGLIASLVDNNLDLYRDLLNDEKLKPFHLVLLEGSPEGIWIEKAKLALGAGYSVEEVASAVYGYPHAFFWSGDESDMWGKWVQQFDQLCSNDDEHIRKVGEAGKVYAESRHKRALERERRDAIFGRE